MSLQFLTVVPFTDLLVLKDQAGDLMKAKGLTRSKALEQIAEDIADCSWEVLLRDHTATLDEDGSCYLLVDGFPVRIDSAEQDRQGNPLAVGGQAFIVVGLHPQCTSFDKALTTGKQMLPGLLIEYHRTDPAEENANPIQIKNPFILNDEAALADKYIEENIPLRLRLGPVVEEIREWVAATLSAPVVGPGIYSKESREALLEEEADRREDVDHLYLLDTLDHGMSAGSTPRQIGHIGRILQRQHPFMPGAYTLLSRDITASKESRLQYARLATQLGELYIETYGSGGITDLIDYWRDTHSHPYMKDMRALAMLAAKIGEIDEAIETLQKMMTLTPQDNQGSRYLLVPLLIQRDGPRDYDAIYDILDSPENHRDSDPILLLLTALASFAREGDTAIARQMRDKAFSQNRYFQILIKQNHDLPPPEAYVMGSPEQAALCLSFARPAILAVKGARDFFLAG